MIMCLLYCLVVFSTHILPILIFISFLMARIYKSKKVGITCFIISLLCSLVTMVVKLCLVTK